MRGSTRAWHATLAAGACGSKVINECFQRTAADFLDFARDCFMTLLRPDYYCLWKGEG